jgi:hypothetical protein
MGDGQGWLIAHYKYLQIMLDFCLIAHYSNNINQANRRSKMKTLAQEIKEFGEVRDGVCVLKIVGDRYQMANTSNIILQKHTLAVNATNDERLEAHWAGFVANNK